MKAETKETVAFRINSKNRKSLDHLAKSYDRDRTYLINKAIENYLELNQWQIDLIEERKKETEETSELISHEDVFSQLEKKIANKS